MAWSAVCQRKCGSSAVALHGGRNRFGSLRVSSFLVGALFINNMPLCYVSCRRCLLFPCAAQARAQTASQSCWR